MRPAAYATFALALAALAAAETAPNGTFYVAPLGPPLCLSGGAVVRISPPPGLTGLLVSGDAPAYASAPDGCRAWLQRGSAVGPDGLLVPPGPPAFWAPALAALNCYAGTAGGATAGLSVAYEAGGGPPSALLCLGVGARALEELWAEWDALRNADVLAVRHVGAGAVGTLYAVFIMALVTAVMFYTTARRESGGGTLWNAETDTAPDARQCISFASALACAALALGAYASATGAAYTYAYRTDGGWQWEPDALQSLVGLIAYPVMNARFAARVLAVPAVFAALSWYMHGRKDGAIIHLAVLASGTQWLASHVLTPSKWALALFSWIFYSIAIARVRGNHAPGGRTTRVVVLGVLLTLDAVVWVGSDAVHATPSTPGCVAHALVDLATAAALPLALRRGAYKRARVLDIDLDAGPEDLPDARSVQAAGVL